eukprot:TRINITY_DN32070_c0_g1_i1.p1 TRINITY_DN32070_c0_g1~~TRINITY_DN32070_c0_g1_i1.p1  ORF type:complete len:745 (-),score=145.21 TRINITY_DN32070_c0_g1_i1:13-2247(-)
MAKAKRSRSFSIKRLLLSISPLLATLSILVWLSQYQQSLLPSKASATDVLLSVRPAWTKERTHTEAEAGERLLQKTSGRGRAAAGRERDSEQQQALPAVQHPPPEPPSHEAPPATDGVSTDAFTASSQTHEAASGEQDVKELSESLSATPEKAPSPEAVAAPADTKWSFCANQWNTCTCSGRVRWGNKETWKIIESPKDGSQLQVKCNIDVLSDVLPGDGDKHCECQESTVPTAAEKPAGEAPTWIFCAGQWQDCVCGGRVRWGNAGKWKIIEPPKDGKLNRVVCSIDALQDILPGDGGKHCDCEITPGTEFYKALNPMLLPEPAAEARAKVDGSRLVSSCELFSSSRTGSRHQALQWEAVEALCSQEWEGRATSDRFLKAGKRKIDLVSTQAMLQARIDGRFVSNYDRLVGKDGWFPRAFVNYYAGDPDKKHAKMTEQLIRSVHLFSTAPIIVVHFGSLTPAHWTASRFPRLVLLHGLPIPSSAQRSFNYNKIRTFLMSRVLVAVQLDSDQFVAPGVDEMFNMTEREVTEDYGLPILPVHFLPDINQAKTPTNIWWQRFCPDRPKCKRHSMRWGHAHPTWTFWALPFFGRWLRRNFRDERLPLTDGQSESAAIEVASIPEDEDMLNVAMWEDVATKQWCKYDNDLHEFADMLNWDPSMKNSCSRGTGCSNIVADPRFYPRGAAKSFFTAHNCKDPGETKAWIDRIDARYKKGLYPPSTIVYNGQFFSSGAALRKKHPELPCIF